MFYLSRLFSGHSLRFLLLLAAAILLAAGIWYLGPFTGFGTTRPLASVSARLLCIVAVVFCLARLWWRIPLFLLIALTASVIVWVIGPWLLAGKSYPLASVTVRLAIVLAIWLLALLYAAWLFMLAALADPTLLTRFSFHKHHESTPENFEAIGRKIRHAEAMTNKARTQWRRWWTALLPGYLPETMPWYVMLGSEGAGKTSLIVTSGQDFPLPEQLNRTERENSPTTNCECWFGNNALFLDTAGKYLSEDDSADNEWQYLLKALHKSRTREGINGAILAVSCTEILQGGSKDILTLATRIRTRLDELRQTLGIHFPVYVVITQLDRLKGFEPWFRSLTQDMRDQVWGVTFPWGEMIHTGTPDLQAKISEELALLQQRLAGTIHPRQQEEYVLSDRKEMYAFPLDFQLLCTALSDFLQQAFFSSRYDETQFCASFRGVYFTSACQTADSLLVNNTSVVTRWRNYFSPSAKETSICCAEKIIQTEAPHARMVWSKHYFLKQLFADVIVGDATLVARNFAEEARYRLRRIMGHVLLIMLAAVLINGFYSSYSNNQRYLDVVSAATRTLESKVVALKQLPSDMMLPKILNMARQLPDFGDLNVQAPPVNYRYGLYTGTAVTTHAERVYRFMLRSFFLPAIQHQATVSLIAALQSQDNEQTYDALKIYLGIYGQGDADKKALIQAITEQWDIADKLTAWEDSRIFVFHLQALMRYPEWLSQGDKMNDALIHQARTLLGQRSLNARLYQRVKSEELAQSMEPMTLERMTGDLSEKILTVKDEALAQDGIPGFFTKAGYLSLIKKKFLYRIMQLAREDEWIMGLHPDAAISPLETRDGVLRLYLREYAEYWNRFLDSIQLITLDGTASASASPLSSDIYVLRILASSGSPLIQLAQQAVEQTTLVAKDKTLSDVLESTVANNYRLTGQAKKWNDLGDYTLQKLTQREVDDRFRALREFVGGNTGAQGSAGAMADMSGSQMNKLTAMLSELYTLFVVTNNSISQGDTPIMPDTGTAMGIQAQTWPNPFRSIISPFLTAASEKVEIQALVSNSQNIDSNLGEICRSTLENRYPFADVAAEVNLQDFENFFARDGLVDSWFKQNLASKVDTSQSEWHYKGTTEAGNLAFFQQVAQIRSAFFASDSGKKMTMTPTLSVVNLDPAIVQLNVGINGNQYRYVHGPIIPWMFQWPASGSVSTLTISAMPTSRGNNSATALNGPWALFRWIEGATQKHLSENGELLLTRFINKRRVDFSLSGVSGNNQSYSDLLHHFHCPAQQ